MLFESKKVLKAKEYQYIEIDKYNHLIKPKSTETEIVEITPTQLVLDFITLIKEYSKCTYLRAWQFPQSYVSISAKKDQNRIASINARIFKEQGLMRKTLMTFVNKYGLFGLMNDEAIGYDYNQLLDDGSYAVCADPVSAVVSDPESMHISVMPYEEYIKKYFPDIPATEAIHLKGADRICNYSEYMEDILQNKRILACTDYVALIDKENNSTFQVQNVNAILSFQNGIPAFDIRYRSLIEYCHSMFFLNEIGGEEKTVRICQYRRCHKPFINKKAKYCCQKCMRNANKAKKEGGQNNG